MIRTPLPPGFERPVLAGPGHLWAEILYILRRRPQLRAAFGEQGLDSAFRERLMLAVTSVNRCRYCSWQHTRLGLQEGLSKLEIRSYLTGDFHDAPDDQVPALLYAQHWASHGGRAEPPASERLVQHYSYEKAELINLVLRMIMLGNLLGNTWDYMLFRISGGRWGNNTVWPPDPR